MNKLLIALICVFSYFIFNANSDAQVKSVYTLKENTLLFSFPPHFDLSSSRDKTIFDIIPSEERIYYSDFKLNYVKNYDLIKINNELFRSTNISTKSVYGSSHLSKSTIEVKKTKTKEFGSINILKLDESRFYDYHYESRQWIKLYKNQYIEPQILDDRVLLRNDHRIFSVPKGGGNGIFSYSPFPSCDGREFYGSFYHTHVNERNFSFVVEKDLIFSKFPEYLVGLKVEKNTFEELWKIKLGKFGVAAGPFYSNNTLIYLVRSPKSEIWLIFANPETGATIHKKYIGISSFMSQNSIKKIKIDADNIFIGTNFGFSLSVNSNSKKINWVRKYKSKDLSLLEFIKNIDNFGLMGNLIPYSSDMSWIDGQLVYYKPKESNHLYVLDKYTGALVRKVNFKSNDKLIANIGKNILLILSRQGEVCSLQAGNIDGERTEILRMNNCTINSVIQNKKVSVQLNKLVVNIELVNDKIIYNTFEISEKGILLAQDSGEFIYLNDGNIYILGRKSQFGKNHSITSEVTELSDSDKIIEYNGVFVRKKIINNMLGGRCEEQLFKFDTEITTKGNLLYHSNITYDVRTINSKKGSIKNGYFLQIVPNQIKSEVDFKYFYAVNGDQILQIKNTGEIVWVKNIMREKAITWTEQVRIYDIATQPVVVIDDNHNLVAFDKETGSYIWSKSRRVHNDLDYKYSREAEFEFKIYNNNIILYADGVLHKIEIRNGFCSEILNLKNLTSSKNFVIKFLEDKIIIVEHQKITYLDPLTFKVQSVSTIEGAFNDVSLNKIKFINEIKSQVIIRSENKLLCYMVGNNKIQELMFLSSDEDYFFGLNDKILAVSNGSHQRIYLTVEDCRVIHREVVNLSRKYNSLIVPGNNNNDDEVVSDKPFGMVNNKYFVNLIKQNNSLRVVIMDMRDNKDKRILINKKLLTNFNGFFYRMSNIKLFNEHVIYFIASLIDSPDAVASTQTDVSSYMVKIDIKSSEIVTEKLTDYSTYRFSRPQLEKVSDYLFFSLANYKLYWRTMGPI